jgi:hypothetical protein
VRCDLRRTRRGCEAAVAAVKDAVGQLVAAKARWDAIAAEMAKLLRLAGRSTQHIPTFPSELAELVRDARRADQGDVPLPIPGVVRTVARVVAPDDPNPVVREPARAKILANRAGDAG